MLMSVLARQYGQAALPDIAGARVLISGLTPAAGFDIARAFADHGARLIVQSPEVSPEMTELAAVLAESAAEIHLFNDPLASDAEAVRLVQAALAACGGLDMAVNLAAVDKAAVRRLETHADVEALVAATLRLPLALTQAAANRMRLVWAEGAVLNVVRVADTAGGRAMMAADALRAALADMTRALAQQWAEHGIRVNAVAPPSSAALLTGEGAASDADLAALAVELASGKARGISGHVLDAAGAARRWC